MIKAEELKSQIEKSAGQMLSNLKVQRTRRLWAEAEAFKIPEILELLKNEHGFDHLCAISGIDAGADYELLYHVAKAGADILTIRTKTPVSDPKIPSITRIFPGAESYEKELEDMFGIKAEGLTPGRRYPLPDDWPAENYPLRKSWKKENLDRPDKKES